ncbi:hypothetical protein [Kingella oralis]|uniref:hypothetical protein n=1 Tax=Kingella oralis TaxID=505 RepID=UPI0034E4D5DA
MKRKLTLATLALALFSAPALADNASQQLNEDCAIVANIALDSMGQFQAGKNQSAALKMLQQKYVKPAKPEAQKLVGNIVEGINNMLYKQPKGTIEIGKTDAERQDHMQAWAAAVYTTCINNGK